MCPPSLTTLQIAALGARLGDISLVIGDAYPAMRTGVCADLVLRLVFQLIAGCSDTHDAHSIGIDTCEDSSSA